MQLRHIILERCECGAGIVAERIRGRHCNGQDREEREFECGCRVQWSPNFERLEVDRECPYRPERKARAQKIGTAKAAILAHIERTLAPLDEEDRRKILDGIENVIDNVKTWGHR